MDKSYQFVAFASSRYAWKTPRAANGRYGPRGEAAPQGTSTNDVATSTRISTWTFRNSVRTSAIRVSSLDPSRAAIVH